MKQGNKIVERVIKQQELPAQLIRWRLINKTISFTNGVFDILHEGHIKILTQAASYADILIVGVNSDASVKRLKGDSRPLNMQDSRALILASLLMVDAVVIFEEDTPLELIKIIKPDVLVKGGDYTLETIVGAKEVMENNGKVEIVPLEAGFSTTGTIEKMKTL
ncbi:MAG: D-glycero-beta-D-manno-heptose 1-phosphate adenylyltransferase [Bacteroidota bacterium]|nr:D-glycero-beta-D-manno-heptose 1-phosphate adenylyltransferase [Bacteroidota bacterium]